MMGFAKTLIMAGVLITVLGIIFYFLGKIPGIGKLPGDIYLKKENFTFYFPLTTCILLSIIISLIFYFINRR